jgi:hypothetical protein
LVELDSKQKSNGGFLFCAEDDPCDFIYHNQPISTEAGKRLGKFQFSAIERKLAMFGRGGEPSYFSI